MPNTNKQVKFVAGLHQNYLSLVEAQTVDLDTIYFLTDTAQIFVGETEYTRPIGHGSALPEGYTPPNALFVVENGSDRTLYYSQGGTAWDKIAVLPLELVEGIYGANTSGQLEFESEITIPKITVGEDGRISKIEDSVVKLPSAPEDASINITGNDSEGNVVTGLTKTGTTGIIVTKGTMVPASGGEFTGNITVPDATEDGHAINKKQVTDAIADAVGDITSFGVDAGEDGEGYATLEALKEAHETGEIGIFYLVKDTTRSANKFIEYFWTGSDYEQAGKFGDVDLTEYAKTEEVTTALAGKVDKTITVNDQPLSDNVTITDITGNAGTADALKHKLTIGDVEFDGTADKEVTIATSVEDLTDTEITDTTTGNALVYENGKWVNKTITEVDNAKALSTARTIAVSGDAEGSTTFDGSANVTIELTVKQAAQATADGDGNNIVETYATKEEMANVVTWSTF